MMKRRKGITREDGNPALERLVAHAFTYTELVDDQIGSMVSRTIIGKPVGTIALFGLGRQVPRKPRLVGGLKGHK